MAARPSSSSSQKLSAPYQIEPAAGALSPIKWRMRVDLPQPEPPMMTKMSPRATVKVRSRCRTKLP